MPTSVETPRNKLINQIVTLLGGNLIDVDMGPEDLNLAVDLAVEKYRQRAQGSTEESVFFLTLQPNNQTYTLPENVVEVGKIYRKGLGVQGGGTTTSSTIDGQQYDPFALAYTNLYLLQPTGQGDLYTAELYSQWLETAGKLFGAEYDFRWNSNTKKLSIYRNQHVYEEVAIKAHTETSEDDLLTGRYTKSWIRAYALAQSKMILGQAYEKFSNLPGAAGGVTLNGAQLKAEAVTEIADLDEQLKQYVEGSRPLSFIIG